MSVTTLPFGTTAGGEAVTAYRLTNSAGASLTVLDYGATVQSLCVPNGQGGFTDVVLGYDTVKAYAVSYTHLDVYKRQSSNWAIRADRSG